MFVHFSINVIHCRGSSLQEFIKLAEFEEKGSITEKLTWAFKVYDKDKSGTISTKEMLEVLGTAITMEGHNKVIFTRSYNNNDK